MTEQEQTAVLPVNEGLVKERATAMIDALEAKAKASGFSFRTILAKSGVEHSTFCRWKKSPPETLMKLAAIELAAEELMASSPSKV